MSKPITAKVRAYSDSNNIAAALVYDVPAAHEIAVWIRQEPKNVVIVKVDGIHWLEMDTETSHHARYGDYVVLTPSGFSVVRDDDEGTN